MPLPGCRYRGSNSWTGRQRPSRSPRGIETTRPSKQAAVHLPKLAFELGTKAAALPVERAKKTAQQTVRH